jgi:hypothetical protein
MNIYFILAAILLFFTYRDYQDEESDTIFLIDSWAWFDVSKSSWPTLYWLCMGAQVIGIISLIICGFRVG